MTCQIAQSAETYGGSATVGDDSHTKKILTVYSCGISFIFVAWWIIIDSRQQFIEEVTSKESNSIDLHNLTQFTVFLSARLFHHKLEIISSSLQA